MRTQPASQKFDFINAEKPPESLIKDNNILNFILDTLDDPIYVMDENYRHIYLNEKSCKVWQRDWEDLINKSIFELYDEETAKKLKKDDDLVFEKGITVENDLHVDLHGEKFVFSISKSLLTDSQKNKKYIVGVCRDVTDRYNAESALKDTKELLRQIIDLDPHQIYARDKNGKYILANKAAAEACKSTVEKVTGAHITDVIPDKKLARDILELDKQIIENQTPSRVKDRKISDLDGNILYFDTLKIPFMTSELNEPAVLGIGLDITELKKAEQAHQESENKFQNLVEMAIEGILIAQDGKITYANKRLTNMCGYDSEELTNTSFIQYVCPEERSKVQEFYEKRIKGENVVKMYELSIVHKDGSHIPVETNVDVITYQGKPAILSFVRDITERKEIEQALKKSEEQYRLIVDNQTDLILKVDCNNNNILFASPSYCKTFGKTEQELIGKTFMPLVHKDDRKSTAEEMKKIFEPPYSIYVEQRVMTKEGWKWFAWVDSAILNEKNEVVEIIGVGRDIHGRKLAEQALQEAKDNLEIRVKDRTKKLLEVNRELEEDIVNRKKAEKRLLESESTLKFQKRNIEHKTVALKEVIGQIENEKNTIKGNIMSNINDIIVPIIKMIQQNDADNKYVDLLWHAMNKITDSFGRKLIHHNYKLTTREIEICILIEKGLTNKEISEMISVSCHTVEKHRRNIRTKLNISNKRINLTTYLRQMS